MPSITILLRETSDVAAALRDMTRAAAIDSSRLRALHPAATDARSQRYYTIETTDDAAPAVLAALRGCPSVEAAFAKPRDATP